jgi:RNA polymerase sigma-70 factor, ECF subfamily
MEPPRKSNRAASVHSVDDRRTSDRLVAEIYDELERLAAHFLVAERRNHTLQPTALVHEAYLRVAAQARVEWQGRSHFAAVAANMMRRVLVDHARKRRRAKRGGGSYVVTLDEGLALAIERDEELVALDEALERLAVEDPRLARLVEYRYFGGLTIDEAAEALDVSTATIARDWTAARAWLRRELLHRKGSA